MERSDLPDKLFAEDTLSYPHSVDGERPADEDRQVSARQDTWRDTATVGSSPTEDMLAVEYREDEVQTGANSGDEVPLDHGRTR